MTNLTESQVVGKLTDDVHVQVRYVFPQTSDVSRTMVIIVYLNTYVQCSMYKEQRSFVKHRNIILVLYLNAFNMFKLLNMSNLAVKSITFGMYIGSCAWHSVKK